MGSTYQLRKTLREAAAASALAMPPAAFLKASKLKSGLLSWWEQPLCVAAISAAYASAGLTSGCGRDRLAWIL